MSAQAEDSVWKKYGFLFHTYISGEKGRVVPGLLFGAAAAALGGAGLPAIVETVLPIVFGGEPLPEPLAGWVRDRFSPEEIPSAAMWAAAVLIPLVIMVRGGAAFLNSYLLAKAGLRILEKLRLRLFERLQELPLAFHERHKRGELLNQVLGNTSLLQGNMIAILNDLVIQPLTLLSAFGYLLYTALRHSEAAMLLVNLAVTGACIPVIKRVGSRMVRKTRRIVDSYADMTSVVEENLTAQRDIRSLNLEEMQVELLRARVQEYIAHSLRLSFWSQALAPAIEVISACALAFSLYMGCRGGLSLEQFAAIAMAFYYCYTPIKTLGGVQNLIRVTGAVYEKMEEVLEAPDETPEPARPVPLVRARGEVSFRRVSFSYLPGVPVLREVSLEVPAGQIVALVGPSGSGKTTFINLICRFYDAREGSVCLDGVDVRRLSRADRARAVGLVSQFPVLFRGSVADNIRVGRPGASDAEVREAARLACADEFIDSSPGGAARLIADGGEGLSGGQRQHISIARAFLKNAPVLILDEATASLDMNSEAQIQRSLESLARRRTTFIVAHRFSAIRMAQRILVFDRGRIVGDGSHDDLYASSPLYRGLFDRQAAGAGKGGAA
ncbi:MAG: ABC transporter ATP-binding protein/permease [Akkermansia sp.]|nr:ABC transporter ATP-binding protein/permease [Akkermansia sp.]